MKKLRQFYYRLFPTFIRLDFRVYHWYDAENLLRSEDGPNWRIAKEDAGLRPPLVALERVKRITE